jgi:putative FmdB family regulatory protein
MPMPIYEYVCETCRHEFNLLRPMNEADAPAACAFCGGKSMAGTNTPSCSGCAGGSCGTCGH